MKFSIKAVGLTSAILWGGCMLVVGLINLGNASYGADFLRLMSSVYPGADSSRDVGRVLLGTVYGFVDGGIAGLLFAALYKLFVKQHTIAHQ